MGKLRSILEQWVHDVQLNIIRTVEVELTNKISELRGSRDHETTACRNSTRRRDDFRKKLAAQAGSQELPPLLTEEELAAYDLQELEYR